MHLFEAIVEANQRATRGDTSAGLRPSDFADVLPIAALSCIDARLNPLLPEVLGIKERDFIWLRNAGNIVTGTTSSSVRSISLACVIKNAKEIAVIGHTDCLVGKTNMMQLTERFRELGIDRARLPENLTEFFGLFASERQNVIKACDLIRQSPLISPRIPVHGLIVDIQTGALEWVINGYQSLGNTVTAPTQSFDKEQKLTLPEFNIGEMKFPEMKIGDMTESAKDFLKGVQLEAERKIGEKASVIADRVKDEFKTALKIEKPYDPRAKMSFPRPPKIPVPPPSDKQ